MQSQTGDPSLSFTSEGDTCFINNLPPELLSRIFEAGTMCGDFKDGNDGTNHSGKYSLNYPNENAENGNKEKTDDEDSDTSPCLLFQVLISHVCQHWRIVALSNPSLWTTISVGPDHYPPYSHVSAMLDRSKNLPLDIYVDCEPSDYDESMPSCAELDFLYSLLVLHIDRWHTIRVSTLKRLHMSSFLTAVSNPSIRSAPQLKALELSQIGNPMVSKRFVPFNGLAPSLTRIVLWGVHVDWDQPWIASASNLVDLELAYHREEVRPSWAQFASILRGAPALEKLTLFKSAPSESPWQWILDRNHEIRPDVDGPIQLLKVTDLTLAFHGQWRVIGLLRKFYLPTLKNLVLNFEDGDYTEFVNVLAGPATSLSQSSTKEQSQSLLSRLEHLRIDGLPWNPAWQDKFYGELDNLVQLRISLMIYPKHYLRDILCTPGSGREGARLPRLKILYVSGTSSGVLCEVIKWRMEAGVPIDRLHAEKSCVMIREDLEWLMNNLKTFGVFEESDDGDDDFEEDDFEDEDDFDSDTDPNVNDLEFDEDEF